MIFEALPRDVALGAILAHSLSLPDGTRLKKGIRLGQQDLEALAGAGIDAVTVARLGPEDIDENAAAWRLAQALVPLPEAAAVRIAEPFTGRVNLLAASAGVLRVDAGRVAAFNSVDPAITIATLPDYTRVADGDMLATLKIIPYGVSEAAVLAAETTIGNAAPLVIHAPERTRARLVLTRTPGFSQKLLAKGQEAVEARLAALGVRVGAVEVVEHRTDAVAAALGKGGADMILILGASATSDARDVCPAGLVAAGGRLERFGMPVDPGNLLFIGRLGDAPVIGLPGCARSPALNGADWVLERVICGIDVGDEDIAAMGVGGLLKEIPTRPQPRAFRLRDGGVSRVEAVLLAAGASRRMAGRDKLLEEIDGEPLIRRAARRLIESRAERVHVVLPPDDAARRAALDGLDCTPLVATEAGMGMSASLRAGLAAVSPRADAAVVALADMPEVTAADIDALISGFRPADGAEICRAIAADGTPGHPVLFGRRFFESLSQLTGDEGARTVLRAAETFVRLIPTQGDNALIDLDTPEAWVAYRGW